MSNEQTTIEPTRFFPGLWTSLKDRSGTYIVTTVIAVLTIFSDSVAGRIKFALNRVDLRQQTYASFSRQLSIYLFDTELMQEYLANGWTTKGGLAPIITDYNTAITNLRGEEYANRALLSRYWGKERSTEFVGVMKDIRAVDSAMHELNDEFEAVNIKNTKEKTDPTKAKGAAEKLQSLLSTFKPETEKLLRDLLE